MVVILRSCLGTFSLDFKMSMNFLPDSAGLVNVKYRWTLKQREMQNILPDLIIFI